MTRRDVIKRILILGGGIGTLAYFVKPSRFFLFPDTASLERHLPMLEVVVESIIPETNSPGAREAGVGAFVLKMVERCTDQRTQNNFISGLEELEQECADRFGCSFAECSSSDRSVLLHAMEEDEINGNAFIAKVERKLFGDPFIRTLKHFTVLGYCTSKLGATQGLAYDLHPGEFVGTIDLDPQQRAWATF